MLYIWSEEAFSERVKARAAAKGITVREVLRRAGLTEDTFSKKTKQGRRIDTILKIAHACDMPPEEAFGLKALKIDVVEEPRGQLRRLALVEHVAAQLYTALSQRPGLTGVASDEIQRLIKALADAVADDQNGESRLTKGREAVEAASNELADTPNHRRRTIEPQSSDQ